MQGHDCNNGYITSSRELLESKGTMAGEKKKKKRKKGKKKPSKQRVHGDPKQNRTTETTHGTSY